MPADSIAHDTAAKAAAFAADAEKTLAEIAKKAEAVVREGLAELRARSRDYADVAGEQVDTAQRYVVDRVQERPVAATVAALGLGVLVGFILAGRKR